MVLAVAMLATRVMGQCHRHDLKHPAWLLLEAISKQRLHKPGKGEANEQG